MLIDSGDGLELCMGGVDESSPPQCAGPVVDGLDPTGWTQSQADVAWGTRTVTVAWPPVDGHLALLSDQPALELDPIGDEAPDDLPDHCRDIDHFVNQDTVSFFANDNPDRTAGARVVNHGAGVVLAVVEDHLEEVRAELATGEAAPCLESVKYSNTQLSAAQDQLRADGLHSPSGPVLGGGYNSLNRLSIWVAVIDGNTVETITSRFDDPGIFHITGSGEIVEGT